MNSGKNLFNSFDVVAKTHDNVKKLMEYCQSAAREKGEFVSISSRYLRKEKSDLYISGWCSTDFILLFQKSTDKVLKTGWRDGAVYLLEINLYDPVFYDEPMVNIAKYEFNISTWNATPISPSSHWIFYDPLYYGHVDYEEDGNAYSGSIIDKEYADRKLWGLRRVTGFSTPLTSITNENAYEIIFGGFKSLLEK